MAEILLLGNPRGRKRRSRRRHHKRRSHRRHRSLPAMFATNPRRRRRHHYRRNPSKRRSRRRSYALHGRGAMGLLKSGLWGAAGALTVDLGMGLVGSALPSSLSSPVDSGSGSTNWGYYAVKGGAAIALGIWGRRMLPAGAAEKMAVGSLTVLSYQVLRGIIPAGSLPLGAYFEPRMTNQVTMGLLNPAPVVGRYNPAAARPTMGLVSRLVRR